MSILILADHDNASLKSVSRSVIAAAGKLGSDIHVLIAGSNCSGAVDAATKCAGVSKVLQADAPAYANGLAENVAPLVAELGKSYSHVLAAHTTYGKNVLPRASALLDVAMISDIIAVDGADTFQRPFYAGNAIATVRSKDAIKVLTVRGTAFDPSPAEGGSAAIEAVSSVHDAGTSQFVRDEIPERNRPELTAARVVISGGRGMQNGENFKLLNGIADKLNAAIGASRAAVDAGFVPNDMQVGQTGKIVAPELYIAIGISGAIQHLAGMKDSKVIAAINKDADAPIFQVSDYGLVADLFIAVPAFEKLL